MEVLLADDRGLVRDPVAAFLCSELGASVRACANLDAAASLMRTTRPDVVVIADALPGLQGLDGLARFVAAHREAPVLLLGTCAACDPAAVRRAGARGFLPREAGRADLAAAVAVLAQGGRVPAVLPEDATPPVALTRREIDVLRGLCGGQTNKEIARGLELQEVTVKLHVKTLSRKLGARNRTHAAMIARDGWMV